MSLPTIAMSAGCLDRIQAFLLSDSVAKRTTDSTLQDTASTTELRSSIELHAVNNKSTGRSIVSAENVSLSPSSSTLPILHDLNFKIKKGSLTIIIGRIGSGKSILLKAVIGELDCSQGSLGNNARDMAYCSQSAWLQNATVRRIVCGPMDDSKIDHEWYNTALYSCAFDEDVLSLPDQHETIIGTRGVALSGGQRQRLVSSSYTVFEYHADSFCIGIGKSHLCSQRACHP